MPVSAARALDPHRPRTTRAQGISAEPQTCRSFRPPTGVPEVHQIREVGAAERGPGGARSGRTGGRTGGAGRRGAGGAGPTQRRAPVPGAPVGAAPARRKPGVFILFLPVTCCAVSAGLGKASSSGKRARGVGVGRGARKFGRAR